MNLQLTEYMYLFVSLLKTNNINLSRIIRVDPIVVSQITNYFELIQ